MAEAEIIDRYALDQLTPAKLRGRRGAAALHVLDERLPMTARDQWALVVALCDRLLTKRGA